MEGISLTFRIFGGLCLVGIIFSMNRGNVLTGKGNLD